MRGTRRFSEAISEGDGISVIVEVSDAEAARAAERQGADAVVVRGALAGVREATELPILWCGPDSPREASEAGADAFLLTADGGAERVEQLAELHARAVELGLDCVVEAHDDDELEEVLERVDPEIVLLVAGALDTDDDALDHVLALLPDVPAGKLALAEVPISTRDDVVALERAGIDGVIVDARNVAELVGGAPPAV